MPRRHQYRRTAGHRVPAGTACVDRRTRFGNPWKTSEHGQREAANRFRDYLQTRRNPPPGWADVVGYPSDEEIRRALAGKDLGCWCPLPGNEGSIDFCHADTLLQVANAPLLLVDIDGVLNPLGPRPAGHRRHRLNGFDVFLDPGAGSDLLDLPFDLAWCTAWEHTANELVAPHVGLPDLPVITFDDDKLGEELDSGLFFKTRAVVEWAAGRAFAWIDDDIDDRDIAWVAERHPGPALLLPIDPDTGLTLDHLDELAAWGHDQIYKDTDASTPQ